MDLWELFIIALGLSMDALAVSICKGFSVQRCRIRHMLICGLYFGIFQAGMPLLGYLLGAQFESLVTATAPFIAFALLSYIGIQMIHESRCGDDEHIDNDFGVSAMIPLAVATSIDALAVGVSFAFLQVSIIPAVLLIGSTTFVCCLLGVKVGSLFGSRYKSSAELFGGVILVLMGLKILLDYLLK